MLLKWFPWRFLVRNAAKKRGFLDPIQIISQLQKFAQPSEVAAPTELLRSGVVLHARGLMNSLAIQHNLDWIWPYWVICQYNPKNISFIPRSFSLTQINLTHRNWTALGIPGISEYTIIDPRGLVTPYYDSWSVDTWMIPETGIPLIPSLRKKISQKLEIKKNLVVVTESSSDTKELKLICKTQVIGSIKEFICQIQIKSHSKIKSWLVVSLRPFNPEGVSFINNISLLSDSAGWLVNHRNKIYFNKLPDKFSFSYYHHGDVFNNLFESLNNKEVHCKVGMATSAALFKIIPGENKEVIVSIPITSPINIASVAKKNISQPFKKIINLVQPKINQETSSEFQKNAEDLWITNLKNICLIEIPERHFKFLFDTAIRSMILHCPNEVYPGPFTYKRFWFRDAAFILYAMLCAGLKERVFQTLDLFRFRQTPLGYFLSQEGEWDSNGEAIWIMRQYCEMTATPLPIEWEDSIRKGAKWIYKKILPKNTKYKHAGLMPAGFSAEHLGPNDFYYWDDFWAISGLRSSAFLLKGKKYDEEVNKMNKEASDLLEVMSKSFEKNSQRLKRLAIPASPYRRLDAGAIGSLVGSYPLKILSHDDKRISDTVNFILDNCMINNGFFHDMTHSGINAYLTLHIAQVLLRMGDKRYFELMKTIANLASSTGQWPEAIHPNTKGGCMGDGQHIWAAAEWVLMIKNCFVREEFGKLILCSGIPSEWIEPGHEISFGPVLTIFGDIKIKIIANHETIRLQWKMNLFSKEPQIYVQLPDFKKTLVPPGLSSLEIKRNKK